MRLCTVTAHRAPYFTGFSETQFKIDSRKHRKIQATAHPAICSNPPGPVFYTVFWRANAILSPFFDENTVFYHVFCEAHFQRKKPRFFGPSVFGRTPPPFYRNSFPTEAHARNTPPPPRCWWLGGWVAGWLGGWVAGWLGGWVAGWLGGWWLGWLVRWLVNRFRYTQIHINVVKNGAFPYHAHVISCHSEGFSSNGDFRCSYFVEKGMKVTQTSSPKSAEKTSIC